MKLLLNLVVFVGLAANAQDDTLYLGIMPMEAGWVTYTEIFEIPGASKETIYSNIKQWAVDAYKWQKATLEVEDKESGYIVYKGDFITTGLYIGGMQNGKQYDNKVSHTLKFYVKEGKVKMQLTHIATSGGYSKARAKMTSYVPKLTRVEDYDLNFHQKVAAGRLSAKKTARWHENIIITTTLLHKQLYVIMKSIKAHLILTKSGFDF